MYDASRVFLDTLGANGFADARPAAIESDARVVGMNFIVANQMAWMGLGGWRVAEGCRALYINLRSGCVSCFFVGFSPSSCSALLFALSRAKSFGDRAIFQLPSTLWRSLISNNFNIT